MTDVTEKVFSKLHVFCYRNNISVTFNPIGELVLTNNRSMYYDVCSIEKMSDIVDNDIDPLKLLSFDLTDNVEYSNGVNLEDMFTVAKQYNLDITITADGDLNVFNGETERQATMSVDEFNEYLQYLELQQKFSDKMR